MARKIRVAAVGAGYFSRFHYDAWRRLDSVELVGLCDQDPDRAKELAARYDVGAVFTDVAAMLDSLQPDLLDIITPPVTHRSCVTAAVDRGILAICQKPFTPDLATAEALVDDIKRQASRVVIHENFRFQPWYQQLKKLLDRQLLGDLYQVSFWLRPGDGQGPEAYLARQPYFQQMDRFLVHETAIHLIDVFRYLFGDITSLFAQLDRLNPVIAGEDAGIILFNFASGLRGLFDGNRLVDHRAKNTRLTMGEMRIEGSAGTLSLNGDGEIHLRKHGAAAAKGQTYAWRDQGFGGDCVYRLNQHVVAHLLDGAALMNQAEDYLVNLRVEEAIYHANAQAARINLSAQGHQTATGA